MNESITIQSGYLLAQTRPAGTSAVLAYNSLSKITEVLMIKICNTTTSPADFSIFHDDTALGGTFDETTALHFESEVPANSTVTLSADSIRSGLVVRKQGQLGVKSSVGSALTYSFYGLDHDLARPYER